VAKYGLLLWQNMAYYSGKVWFITVAKYGLLLW
jgi:hypothetical protein